MEHEEFTLKNPNRLRSVVGAFAGSQNKFHAKDGSGYKFLGNLILEVDQLNPQVKPLFCYPLVLLFPWQPLFACVFQSEPPSSTSSPLLLHDRALHSTICNLCLLHHRYSAPTFTSPLPPYPNKRLCNVFAFWESRSLFGL